MENNLINSYIHAVVRHLPPEQAADVESELSSQIADMLKERCGDVEPSKHDIEAVLAQLGSPEELAHKYHSGRKALIGGIYYFNNYSTNDLPNIPEAKQRITPFWPIFGIIFAVASAVVFLGFPQIFSLRIDGEWISAFNISAIRALWLPIMLFAALEICSNLMQLIERRYTIRLAAVTLIVGLLQIILAVVIFRDNAIVNPDFVNRISYVFADTDSRAVEILRDNVVTSPNTVMMVVMIGIVFFEVLDVVVKTFQSGRAWSREVS